MIRLLEVLYILIGIAEVASEFLENETLRFFTKPLLMPVLIFFFAKSITIKTERIHKLMVAAFFFSWVGDVALMFVPRHGADFQLMGLPKHPNFFLAGLGGFLITHVLYCIAFADVTDKQAPTLLPSKFWMITPLLLYMVGLLSMLVPGITGNTATKDFLIPVLVYSATIATMVYFSINRYGRVNNRSFILVFGGAILFMVSDSVIAINKFLHPFQMAGVIIMVLYISAQYLIAKGMLAQNKD